MELLAAIKMKVLDLQEDCTSNQEYDAYNNVLEYIESLGQQVRQWQSPWSQSESGLPMTGIDGAKIIMSNEEREIRQAMLLHANNRKKVAEELGISERTLYRKIKEYGIC